MAARLSSRERMLAALSFEEPDYVPCCFSEFISLRNKCTGQQEFVDRQLEMGLDVVVDIEDPPVRHAGRNQGAGPRSDLGPCARRRVHPGARDQRARRYRARLGECQSDDRDVADPARVPRVSVGTPDRFGQAGIEDVVADIEYIIDLVGRDHVGLGSDLYGLEKAPKGLEEISRIPILTERLVQRGHSDEVILKFLGGNIMRVFEQVWQA